jgi:hypothetical protein
VTASVRLVIDGQWTAYVRPRVPASPFIPGVTEPFYISEGTDIDAASTNVGNRATRSDGIPLTTWTGPVTAGTYRLEDGATYRNILFNGVVDLRNGEQLINCRVVVPKTYTQADSIGSCIRILSGATNTDALLQNVEIHNRAQRPMNGVNGRNYEVRECVVTGCIDGFIDNGVSTTGAPMNYAYNGFDSVVTDMAWWYSPTANSLIHPSDTQAHIDCWQVSSVLQGDMDNCVGFAYLSEEIGNPYVPASGYNFIATQAVQNGWRASLTGLSVASQTKYGIARRLPTTGGSVAALMVNRNNFSFTNGYLAGGIATVNLRDVNLPTTMNVNISNTQFDNGMLNPAGHGTTKGHAILITAGKTANLTGNTFFDGTPVSPTYV